MNLNIDTETGPGVFETALAYTTALRMADNAILFKYLAKSIGIKYGIVPSFMAKPWGGNVRLSYFPVSLLG
jgi:glutamine synthetase